MTHSRDELMELVRVGSLQAISALSANHGDPILGFALCTDDDVSSFFHVGCTASFARISVVPEVRFLPNEWLQNGDREAVALQIASREFQQTSRRPEGDGWGAARDDDFKMLVAGLAAARATGAIDAAVFLTVMSTDPCDYMLNLEEALLPLLNPPHIMREWRQWRLDDAQDALKRLHAKPRPRSYAEQDRIERLRADVRRFRALLET